MPDPHELSPELIQQYKDALSKATDLRLVVLLVFNAFEEVMKAVAAWRLGCALDDLPKQLTNSPSLLFDVVLTAEKSAKKLRDRARQLSELRNAVAHGFHKRKYKPLLSEFVQAISGIRKAVSDFRSQTSTGVDRRGEFAGSRHRGARH